MQYTVDITRKPSLR